MTQTPKINVDILVVKDNKILLGLLTEKWNAEGRQVYGVPGRDVRFGEAIGDAIKRNIREECDCEVTDYKIICVNANYALGNHYIGIGAITKINGEPKVLVPDDWTKWEWFDLHSIPNNLFQAARNLIECYKSDEVCVAE